MEITRVTNQTECLNLKEDLEKTFERNTEKLRGIIDDLLEQQEQKSEAEEPPTPLS